MELTANEAQAYLVDGQLKKEDKGKEKYVSIHQVFALSAETIQTQNQPTNLEYIL